MDCRRADVSSHTSSTIPNGRQMPYLGQPPPRGPAAPQSRSSSYASMGKAESEYDVEAGEKPQLRKVATNDSTVSSDSSVRPTKRAKYVVIF